MKPIISRIKPIASAANAFSLGPPGKFMNLARFGLIKAANPIRLVIIPVIKSTWFIIFIF